MDDRESGVKDAEKPQARAPKGTETGLSGVTRLQSRGPGPIPPQALEATARSRQALAFQSECLVHLIDDLLKAETQGAKGEKVAFPDLRLPGDNPNDASRYLLRGLRNELRNLSGCLAAMDRTPDAPASRLVTLRELAVAVAQLFSTLPPCGAGRAILSLLGNILVASGLTTWPEFLRSYGGAHARPWAVVDVSGHAAAAPVQPLSVAPKKKSKDKDKAKRKAEKKAKGKAKKKAKKAASAGGAA